MNTVSIELFIEKLGVDVYPVTLLKFLLNKGKILFCFSKAASSTFEMRGNYNISHDDCDLCLDLKDDGILCRKHTSIERIVNSKNVLFDIDTNAYFINNEIFRIVGDKLVVIYCPHTKLMNGIITNEKVRKIRPLTFYEEGFELPKFENVIQILSSDLMNKNMKCWFNKEFSIITVPNIHEECDFVLTPNI